MIIKRQLGEKGQVVIPKDIREFLKLRQGENIIFEVKNEEITLKKEQNAKEVLNDFFTIARTKRKDLTLKDLKKIEDESYDLP